MFISLVTLDNSNLINDQMNDDKFVGHRLKNVFYC